MSINRSTSQLLIWIRNRSLRIIQVLFPAARESLRRRRTGAPAFTTAGSGPMPIEPHGGSSPTQFFLRVPLSGLVLGTGRKGG